MKTDALGRLILIARLGSIAAAARQRNVDPSMIGRTVAEAEAEIGARLFHRSTRQPTLTESGRRYLARLEPVLDRLARAGGGRPRHPALAAAGGGPDRPLARTPRHRDRLRYGRLGGLSEPRATIGRRSG